MRVVYISLENPYNALNNGGIGTYTGVVAEALCQLGNEVHLITVGEEKESYNYKKAGLYIHLISKPVAERMFYLEQACKINRTVQELISEEIDLIEAPEWLAQGVVIAREGKVPVITRLHTPLFIIENICQGQRIYRDSKEIKEYEKMQARNSVMVTAPCRAISNLVKEAWEVESEIIPNPINVFNYEISYCDDPVILYMGRLEYRKGVLVFAKCIESLVRNNRNLKIIFCGQDTVYKKRSIKKSIEEICQNVSEHVEFIPHANEEEKRQLLKKTKVVVIPSLWENFSYVCLEAMACGKTVVATSCGGFDEIIANNESGYLVTPGKSGELYRVLSAILNEDLPDTGIRARKIVEEKFDIGILGKRYLELYYSIIS